MKLEKADDDDDDGIDNETATMRMMQRASRALQIGRTSRLTCALPRSARETNPKENKNDFRITCFLFLPPFSGDSKTLFSSFILQYVYVPVESQFACQ